MLLVIRLLTVHLNSIELGERQEIIASHLNRKFKT